MRVGGRRQTFATREHGGRALLLPIRDLQINPARDHLDDVNFQLSRQITSLALEAVTGNPQAIVDYGAAVAAQRPAMLALDADTRLLGAIHAARFSELRQASDGWHAAVAHYLQERAANRASRAYPAMYGGSYPRVIDAVSRLDNAITATSSVHLDRSRHLARVQTNASFVLFVLAIIASSIVLWTTARLRSLAWALEQESDARKAALERETEIRKTAESLVRSRDEILGIVSHDLRSPLTTISLTAQLMPGSSPDEMAVHADTIRANTRRMQRLIQDLLDATRAENATLSIRRDRVDVGALAAEAVRAHAPIAGENHVTFEPTIRTPLPKIRGDYDRLLQALSNLLGNALKFTPTGGRVRLTVEPVQQNVRFNVCDSGPGIAPSDVPHLFEPFWQAKKTAHLGAGLGLKITKAIVEAHGGTMVVSNAPEGGACFTFDIAAESQNEQAS